MTYHLVIRIRSDKHIGERLYRDDIVFAVPPVVGDAVSWHGDWGCATVTYRYIGTDWVELGLGVVGEHEIESYVAAGWTFR